MSGQRLERHLGDVVEALVDRTVVDPVEAVQWSVVDRHGRRHLFGDQVWIRDGGVLGDYPGGRVEYRTIALIYGEWKAQP